MVLGARFLGLRGLCFWPMWTKFLVRVDYRLLVLVDYVCWYVWTTFLVRVDYVSGQRGYVFGPCGLAFGPCGLVFGPSKKKKKEMVRGD